MIAVLVLGTLNASTPLAQVRARVRSIPDDPRRTIESRLLANDQVVIVSRPEGLVAVKVHSVSKKEVIEEVALGADAVVLVECKKVDSVVTENGTWIEAHAYGDVREVIRLSEAGHISIGQSIEVNVGPGEKRFGSVLVIAREDQENETRYMRLIQPSRLYLLFIKDSALGGVPLTIHPPLRVERDKLAYAWPPAPSVFEPPEAMQGMTLAEVTRIVRLAKNP